MGLGSIVGLGPALEPSADAGGFCAFPTVPLIGLAHGSRHPGVSASLTELMDAAATVGGMPARGAFLDLAEPDLTTVAVALAAQGHHSAVVAPLLFTEAFHARVDVPQAVRDAAEASGLELVTADILGTDEDMVEVVQQSMAEANIADDLSVVLVSVGSSQREANDAVVDLAHRLAQRRSGRVVAAFGTRSPRVVEVLPDLRGPIAIVPLFLSPGLLLDPLAELATEHGMLMAAPLGTRVAPLLVRRYEQALARATR